jgi:hypothetical protein
MLWAMNEVSVRLMWPDFIYELAESIRAFPKAPPLYLVGGAVRDAYLRRDVSDIDIAVDGDAIALARWVTDAWKADIYIMDRERGVARVFVKVDDRKVTIDFAKLRGGTLEEDLHDRDFSMNAMAADLLRDAGALIDPLRGLSDLKKKTLRRCSARSIANDPIRALRAVRLSAQFELKIQPETARDIRQFAGELSRSSPERIRDEFFKLLGLEKAARGLRALGHIGALEQILPQISIQGDSLQFDSDRIDSWSRGLAVVERMSAIITAISSRRTDNSAAAFDLGMLVIQFDRFRASLQGHLDRVYGNGRTRAELLILAALLHGLGEMGSIDQAGAVASSLRLTKDEGRNLCVAVGNFVQISGRENWTRLDQHRFWHELGAGGIDAILLSLATVMGRRGRELKQGDWLKLVERSTILLGIYFNRYDEVVNPRLLLDGSDVRELLDIGSGPRVGKLLRALREAQVAGEVESVDEAREFVLRSAGA